MTVEGILIVLLIGAIAGWLAGVIVRGGGFGLIGNIIIGILGAFVSTYLLPKIGIVIGNDGSIIGQILYAMVGAIVVLLLISLVRRA